MRVLKLSALSALALALSTSAFAQADARKGYIIQLADDPAAAYAGGVSGLAATKPAAGAKIDVRAVHVQNYLSYLDAKVAATAATVPAAQIYHRYGVALNGFAAQLTDAELAKLAADPSVRAITADTPRRMDTLSTPKFLGISGPNGAWTKLDAQGRPIRGEDVIIAHVDGGVWPENRSFADHVDAQGRAVFGGTPNSTLAYGPLPAGRYLGTCQPGMGFTAAHCNNKLIGAYYFNSGWKANAAGTWQFEYLDSPRDPDGHGTHTLSTSGGNTDAMTPQGVLISGMAPRARVASYRVCYSGTGGPDATTGNGCYPSDSVAAINKAVADKADVINYSISGSQTSARDAVGEAFKNAAAAGVFVAVSAGNSGPGNAVAHLGTWLTTVANSTHDRYTIATVTLPNVGAFTGAARFQGNGPLAAATILSSEAMGPGSNATAATLCYAKADNGGVLALDPEKVAGKIVVCERGTNARVNKSLAVLEAGGAGMILLNPSDNTLNNDEHAVPTVHLQANSYAAVRAYALTKGNASIGASSAATDVIAPIMATSSSRGPNKGDANVLKPDISAPGTDVFAAYGGRVNANVTDRNAILAGTAAGAESAASLTGTSMASPHIAGIAALLKQANPTWSPYAIKSALMTSAQQSVKLGNGSADADRWGYGAGHVDPKAALATKLVYDSTAADHQAYFSNTKAGADINLASLTRSDIIVSAEITRTVTNRGAATVNYTGAATVPGFDTTITPSSFQLAPGASQTFKVRLVTQPSTVPETWSFGQLTWTGSDGSVTRSPVSAKAVGVLAASEIVDARVAGSKAFTIGLGYTGSVTTTATGLVPAVRLSAAVATAPSSLFCFNGATFTVAEGSKLLRVQMFNSETQGGASTDFDLYVQRNAQANGSGAWSTVQLSGNDGSDELVNLRYPQSGLYRLCFVPYNTGSSAKSFTINRWLVGPTVTPSTLRALGAGSVSAGGVAAVAASWQGTAGVRSLGAVEFSAGAGKPPIGMTSVFIDPVSPAVGVPTGGAVVYRDKVTLAD